MPEATATKPRILFVEDEVTVRDHLAQKLSDDYVVDTADKELTTPIVLKPLALTNSTYEQPLPQSLIPRAAHAP